MKRILTEAVILPFSCRNSGRRCLPPSTVRHSWCRSQRPRQERKVARRGKSSLLAEQVDAGAIAGKCLTRKPRWHISRRHISRWHINRWHIWGTSRTSAEGVFLDRGEQSQDSGQGKDRHPTDDAAKQNAEEATPADSGPGNGHHIGLTLPFELNILNPFLGNGHQQNWRLQSLEPIQSRQKPATNQKRIDRAETSYGYLLSFQ